MITASAMAVNQLEANREELKGQCANRRAELSNLGLVVHYIEDLQNLLDQSPLTEQKAFIRSTVKEVRVTDKEAELIYNTPAPGGNTHRKWEDQNVKVKIGTL